MSGKVCKTEVRTIHPKSCFDSLAAWKKCRADKAIRLPKLKKPKDPFQMKARDAFAYWNRQSLFSRRKLFQYRSDGRLSFKNLFARKPEDVVSLKLYKTSLGGPLDTLKSRGSHDEAYRFLSKHKEHELVRKSSVYLTSLVTKLNKTRINIMSSVRGDGKARNNADGEWFNAHAKLSFAVRALKKIIPNYDAMTKDRIAFGELGSRMDGTPNPYVALAFIHIMVPQALSRGGKPKLKIISKHTQRIAELLKKPLSKWDKQHVATLDSELTVAKQRIGNLYRFYKHKIDFIEKFQRLNQYTAGWTEARNKVLERYTLEDKSALVDKIKLGEQLLRTGYHYGPRTEKDDKGEYYVDHMYGMVGAIETGYNKDYKVAIDQFYNDVKAAHQKTKAYKKQQLAITRQKSWMQDYSKVAELQQRLTLIKRGKITDPKIIDTTLKALMTFTAERVGGKTSSGVKTTLAQAGDSANAWSYCQSSNPSMRKLGFRMAIKAADSARKTFQTHLLRNVKKNFKLAKKLPKHLFWDGMRTRVAKKISEARYAKSSAAFMKAYQYASFLTSVGAQMYVLHTMQKNGKQLTNEADSQNMFRTAYSFGLKTMPGLKKTKTNSSMDTHTALSNLSELATIFYWGVTPGKKRRFQKLSLGAVRDIGMAATSFGKLAKHVKGFTWVSWARDIGIIVYTLALTEVAALAAGPALVAGGTRIFFSARSIAALSKIGIQGERAMKFAQFMVRGTRFMGTSAIGAGMITASQIPAQLRAGGKLNFTRNFFRHFLTFIIAGPIVGIATRFLKLSSASGFLTSKFFKWMKGGKASAAEASAFSRAAATVAQKYGVNDKWVQILLKGGKGKVAAWGITTATATSKILGSLATEVAAYYTAGRISHAALGGHKETLLQQLQGLLMFKALHASVSPAFSKARIESLQRNIKKVNDKVRALEASGNAKPSELMKLSQQGLLHIVEYRALKYQPGSKTEHYKGVASNLLKTYANAASGIAGRGLSAVLIATFSVANTKDAVFKKDFTANLRKLSKTEKAAVEKAMREMSNDPAHALAEFNRVLKKRGFKLDANFQLRRVGDKTDYSIATSSTTPAPAPSGWARSMKSLREALAGLAEGLRIALFPRNKRERALAHRGAVALGGGRRKATVAPDPEGTNAAHAQGKKNKAAAKVEAPDPARNNRPAGNNREASIAAKAKKLEEDRQPMTFDQKLKANKKLRLPEGIIYDTSIPHLVRGQKQSKPDTVIIVKNEGYRSKLLLALTGSHSPDRMPQGWKIRTQAEQYARTQVTKAVRKAVTIKVDRYSSKLSNKHRKQVNALSRYIDQVIAYQTKRYAERKTGPRPTIDKRSSKDVRLLRGIKDHPIMQNLQGVMTKPLPRKLPSQTPNPATKGKGTNVTARRAAFEGKESDGAPPAPPKERSQTDRLKRAIKQEEAYHESDTFKKLPPLIKKIKWESLAKDKQKLKDLLAEEASGGSFVKSPSAADSVATNPGAPLAPKPIKGRSDNRPVVQPGERANTPTVVTSNPNIPRPAHTPTPSGQHSPEGVAKKLFAGVKKAVDAVNKNPSLKSILFLGASLLTSLAGMPVAFGLTIPAGNRRVSIRVKGQSSGTYLHEGQELNIGRRVNDSGGRGRLFIDVETGRPNIICMEGKLTIIRADGRRRTLNPGESRALSKNDRIHDGHKEYMLGGTENTAPSSSLAGSPHRGNNRVVGTQPAKWDAKIHAYPKQLVVSDLANTRSLILHEGRLRNADGTAEVSFVRNQHGMWQVKCTKGYAKVQVNGQWVDFAAGQSVGVMHGTKVSFGASHWSPANWESAQIRFPLTPRGTTPAVNQNRLPTQPPPVATPAGTPTGVWNQPVASLARLRRPLGTTPPMTPATSNATPVNRYRLANWAIPWNIKGRVHFNNPLPRGIRTGPMCRVTKREPMNDLGWAGSSSIFNGETITFGTKNGSHIINVPNVNVSITRRDVNGAPTFSIRNEGGPMKVKTSYGKIVDVRGRSTTQLTGVETLIFGNKYEFDIRTGR